MVAAGEDTLAEGDLGVCWVGRGREESGGKASREVGGLKNGAPQGEIFGPHLSPVPHF